MTGKKFQVYWLSEAPVNVHAVVRYDGDPDVFTALAYEWLLRERRYEDLVAVCPPEPKFYRWNVNAYDDPPLILADRSGPGRGTWIGALLKTVRIGCEECNRVYGAGHAEECLNYGVTALMTLQFRGNKFQAGKFLTTEIVHAVRWREGRPGRLPGTPGPTLCGLDRFGPTTPAWSVGGGLLVDGARGCYLCQRVAREQFAGMAIHGSLALAQEFAGEKTPLAAHLVDQLLVKASNRTAELVRR